MKDRFNFYLPAELEKGKSEDTGEEVMKIKGIASTPDKDSDGEILEPMGFDVSRFLSHGFFNYNHLGRKDASAIIGEPTKAEVTNKGLYIEGELYKGHPLAKSVWELAKILTKNNSKRRLGYSIEGRALERDKMNPKRITKALITGCAVTPSPVNKNTFLDLVKGEQSEDFVEVQVEPEKTDNDYLYETTLGGRTYRVNKSFQFIEVEKAITAGGGTGSATTNQGNLAGNQVLKPESIDKKKKDIACIHKSINIISKAIDGNLFNEEVCGKIKEKIVEFIK